MRHLAIPVSDQERSRRFYETYFGFGAGPASRYSDGVVMLRNGAGFDLALGPAEPGTAIEQPPFLHFGVRHDDAAAVRALAERLRADGVEIVEEWDEPGYASVKCLDPDGYVVETYWEPASD